MNIIVRDMPGQRRQDGLSTIKVLIPSLGIDTRVDVAITELVRHSRLPLPLALDFLLLASVCYGVDKLVDRASMEDRWTREFSITIPVSAPDIWAGAANSLGDALRFLSGDLWELNFVATAGALYRRPARRSRTIAPALVFHLDAVCLFSGGLDSLAGAIDLLESEGNPKVLLISHYDAPTGEQADLLGPLQNAYPRRVRQVRTRVRLDPVAGAEPTLRTRSLLFLALGVFAASATGTDVPLYAYENGHIALNVPLTPSRAGSCSTRTMHPYFLDRLIAALQTVGINNPIRRPYEMKTKGECVTECRNSDLLRSSVELSVSCSHPSRRQHWVRREARNCGYCVPCLIRRAALYKAGLDEGARYGLDVCRGELSPNDPGESADDLRAVLDFLRQGKEVGALASDIRRVAAVDQLAERAALVDRGFAEMRALFANKGNASVCAAAGIIAMGSTRGT